jgi:DNA repair photolyase
MPWIVSSANFRRCEGEIMIMNAEQQLKQEPTAPATWGAPYFIGLGRAMVSLGPISKNRYCPYQCRFCYVQGPFPKYESATVSEIVMWLEERRDQYDIVYISGDTDSFAQPRTEEGLDLIEALLRLKVDVLFTTRYVFSGSELERLGSITSKYREERLLLIGCISISQLHHPQLEPPPIESPYRRTQLLREMQTLGIVTALTIRPFIPSVPAAEYREIAAIAGEFGDVVLGGDLYLDSNGAVLQGIRTAGQSLDLDSSRSRVRPLDFSLTDDDWMVLSHPEAAAQVSAACEELGKPFYLRSAGAISWIRERRNTFIER